jgi:molecular chaperone Hsp33
MVIASAPDKNDSQEAADNPPQDEIVRCTVRGGDARVVVVTAAGVAREAARRHEATGAAAVALARGLSAGLLLATLTKDQERVTLQLLGDGPLGGLTVDATSGGTARAYVRNAGVPLSGGPRSRPSLAAAMGRDGIVNVVRDVGLAEGFRGRTPLVSGEIDEDCEHYLTSSEQIESALRCETVLDAQGELLASAGILVQALPGGRGAAVVQAARERLHGGALVAALAAGGPAADAGGLVEEALGEVLGAWTALEARPVRFHCPCSRERAGASLALLGAAELHAMILEDGKAEVICNFCRARHDFDDAELERIRRELGGSSGPPS